MFSTC